MQTRRITFGDGFALCVLAAFAAVIAVAIWRTGFGMGPDSVTYIDRAQNLVAGRGFVHHWAYWDPVYATCKLPTSNSLWPPGYSLCIAAAIALGADGETAARLITAVSYILLLLPLYGILRMTHRVGAAAFLTMCCICVLPIVTLSAVVSTEVPFLLLASISAWAIIHAAHAQTPRSADRLWIVAGIFAGLALNYRLVGVGTNAALVVAAYVVSGRRRIRAVFLAGIPAALISLIALVPRWIARFTDGPTWPGADIFWKTLPTAIRGVIGALIGSKELLSESPWSLLRPVGLTIGAVVFLLTIIRFVRQRRELYTPDAPARTTLIVMSLFCGFKIAVVLAARATEGMDVEERYVTLIWPWMVLILASVLFAPRGNQTPSATAGDNREIGALPTAGFALMTFWLLCQFAVIRHWISKPDTSIVLQKRNSPTIGWIRANVPADELILNTRGAEIALWVPNPMLRLPRTPFSRIHTMNWNIADQVADKARAKILVHWPGYPESSKYNDEEFKFLRSLDHPENHPERNPVVLPDSIIYHVGHGR